MQSAGGVEQKRGVMGKGILALANFDNTLILEFDPHGRSDYQYAGLLEQ